MWKRTEISGSPWSKLGGCAGLQGDVSSPTCISYGYPMNTTGASDLHPLCTESGRRSLDTRLLGFRASSGSGSKGSVLWGVRDDTLVAFTLVTEASTNASQRIG